jgi:predicted PurR-regulated permease PerM
MANGKKRFFMETPFLNSRVFRYLMLLHGIVLVLIILYLGKALFVTLGYALFISFILYPLCRWLENRGYSRMFSIALPIVLLCLFLFGIGFLLATQMIAFAYDWTSIKVKLMEMAEQLSHFMADNFGLSADKQNQILRNTIDNSSNTILQWLRNTASSFAAGLVMLIMVPIFASLLLYFRHKLIDLTYRLFPTSTLEAMKDIFYEVVRIYYNFVKGMALVYLTVGTLNSIGLALIGIPYPTLFGFLAAILTFIPYVGIITAAILPITYAWITFDSAWYPLGVIFVFALVQLLEAYVIFPLVVGKRMKINTLVIFLAIIIGGVLWGAAGMILSIPMVSIFKLIADRIPEWKFVAEFLE